MVHVHFLTTLDLPELQPYRTLRQPIEHFTKGLFVAEGEKVVRRLLGTPIPVISVLLTPEWFAVYEPLLQQRAESITAFCGPKELLETIVGYHLHQGIMALARIPHTLTLKEFVDRATPPYLFVALDGLTNAENVGVIVRNCAAFGVHGILVGETSSSPYLRRAVRNSMGSVFTLPIYHSPELVRDLTILKASYNCSILAAHPHAESTLPQLQTRDNLCIVFGSEGEGISPTVLSTCTHTAAIPMANGVDSLNVASASAVFLYEIYRRRILSMEQP